MLRAIHRCLAPGGSLRLILINPAPEVNTLGPRLRTWLEKHLLLNLELKFRCMNPTKLFPNWLEETHLRAEGSTIVRPKFHAIAGDLPKVEDLETHFDITPRLYSQVGRMLWKEVWGRHVATDNWWWEDKSIVQECKELGTFWQYHLITAVRQESE
ncbi:hypothetical protein UCRPA7_8385 [Phaeoacremonium minimum UCRPA7]|uniref:Uncharacterized protein n=1 Tax=Phaeoacremonium minimum (strain UCR-PA7) TaxID=1286976 RepID=R8B9X3_PHAM7|nr:hypothetical protein UCRPA7_8385 [Phaeoacremonium minimum UCRPA7]EON96115.1 hypothetical protein UCRPA7_8385 [Phaeoacremonium minimum UCRPA7]